MQFINHFGVFISLAPDFNLINHCGARFQELRNVSRRQTFERHSPRGAAEVARCMGVAAMGVVAGKNSQKSALQAIYISN